jgi:hypothetical protein
MKQNPILKFIVKRAKENKFVTFSYIKPETGEVSERTCRFGVDLEKSLAKHDKPLNGRGAWMTGHTSNKNSFVVRKNGESYIRGTQVCSKGGENATSKPGHRLFKISGISNLR